jgi:outer membrane protein OmpA-like peptidoglycan-associated protein
VRTFSLLFFALLLSSCATARTKNIPCRPAFNLTGPAATCGEKPLAVLAPQKKQIEILERIQFEFARAELKPESHQILDAVAKIMRAHPEIRGVRIEGHASAEGSLEFNMKLSKERAEAVRKYLIQAGIPENQLDAEGYGSYRPAAPNDTDEGRERNRRCEFHILDDGQRAL